MDQGPLCGEAGHIELRGLEFILVAEGILDGQRPEIAAVLQVFGVQYAAARIDGCGYY